LRCCLAGLIGLLPQEDSAKLKAKRQIMLRERIHFPSVLIGL